MSRLPAPALAALLSCAALAPSLHAQDAESADSARPDFPKALASLESDLEASLGELAGIRARIAEEKPPLAKKLNETGATLRERQRDYDIAVSRRETVDAELEKAKNDLKLWRDERAYIQGLLVDFRRNLEANATMAQVESQRELFDRASQPDDEGDAARAELIERSIQRLARAGSVATFPGKALDASGTLIPGTFAEAGPVSWFLSDSGTLSGMALPGETLRPEVLPGTGGDSAIRALVDGKSATPTFDPTLGTAIALEETETTLLEHVKQGGLWIYPILLLAAVALLAALFKWLQLLRIRGFRSHLVQDVIDAVNENKPERARAFLDKVRHPARQLLARGVEMSGKPADEIEEALYEKHVEAQPPLQRGLPLIAIASATAPLLGLLGTVTGMIHTFKLINIFGTGDAKSLASGISEALVTTEFGLIVAIPALIAHALLSRKVQGIKTEMEMTSLAFLNGIKTAN